MAKIASRISAVVVVILAGVGMAQLASSQSPNTKNIVINVKSSDPTRVSGGDALIEITTSGSATSTNLRVTANGTDVSKAFKASGVKGRYLGVVTNLKVGENMIAANQGSDTSTIKLVNHPITGPVFAGPKEMPFFCETTKFKMADGSALSAPIDADCSLKTTVTYVYKPVGSKEFKGLPNGTTVPKDAAQTTTTTGQKVPYIVRVETGTIDRGIYQIAVLHDPASETTPTPFSSPKAWNQKMVYTFGGGCGGIYRQGPTAGDVLDDQFVGQGYVVMSNSLNVFANNCDDLLAAEVMMMTREHALKEFGVPVYTLGWGCSGGSHQVLMISDNYPGLMDGIIPLCDSVDGSRLGQLSSDLALLHDWFKSPSAKSLTDNQKQAVTGTTLEAAAMTNLYNASSCPDVVPPNQVFNPETNPKGLRCTVHDHQVNSLGRDPKTGFAWSLVDNVGVQYGLNALQSGTISVAQFLDLNQQIGGYDANGIRSSARSVADARGIEAAYRTGRVLNAGGGLKNIPILELRNYSDGDKAAVHLKFATYSVKGRLERENGTRANYVILLESHRNGFMSASRNGGDDMSHYAIKKMDEWLSTIVADKASGTPQEKVIRDKPKDLVDSCYDQKDGTRIVEEQTFSGGECNKLYPTYPPPRMVAGGPVTNDVIKCQLKPVVAADYKVKFSAAEFARLQKSFPQGVCDWSKPGIGQVKPAGTWQSF